MGYLTCYDLDIIGDDDKVKDFEKDLLSKGKYENGVIDSNLRELIETGTVMAKLYDLEDWISDVAPKHPDVLVSLYGDGEESDDTWEARWKGDKHEKQYSVIPPFITPELQIN